MTKRLALGSLVLLTTTILGGGVAQATEPWTGGCTINYTIDPSAKSYERQIIRGLRELSAISDIAFVHTDNDIDITYVSSRDSGQPYVEGRETLGTWNSDTHVAWLTSIYLPGQHKRSLVIHETMHALGIEHSDDPESIMNPDPMGRVAFSLYDLSAILKVSVANDCGY